MKKLITGIENKGFNVIITLCDCGDPSHLLMFINDKKDENEYCCNIVRSDQGTLWGRLKYAIKYVIHGPYMDTVILDKDSIKELAVSLLKTLKK